MPHPYCAFARVGTFLLGTAWIISVRAYNLANETDPGTNWCHARAVVCAVQDIQLQHTNAAAKGAGNRATSASAVLDVRERALGAKQLGLRRTLSVNKSIHHRRNEANQDQQNNSRHAISSPGDARFAIQ